VSFLLLKFLFVSWCQTLFSQSSVEHCLPVNVINAKSVVYHSITPVNSLMTHRKQQKWKWW